MRTDSPLPVGQVNDAQPINTAPRREGGRREHHFNPSNRDLISCTRGGGGQGAVTRERMKDTQLRVGFSTNFIVLY